MNENLDPTDSDYNNEELEIDKALRPLAFSDFSGQEHILENLNLHEQLLLVDQLILR